LMHELVAAAVIKIHDFNPQDLANTAWAVANLRMRDSTLMDSISAQARSKLSHFEGSDFSTTAWAFSVLGEEHKTLLDAISAEAIKKIDSLGAQQLGTLVDLGLPCQGDIEAQLQKTVSRFLVSMPSNLEGFQKGWYQGLVSDFEVDNFGSKGDRFLLDTLGIFEGPQTFTKKGAQLVIEYQQQHAESWWRSEGLLHNRVVSYAELDLTPPGHGATSIAGARYQQNGYQGSRLVSDKILPTQLPFNHNVDRSLCSEFQLLTGVCQDLLQSQKGDVVRFLAQVQGWLRLFVTGAPCLSCVGAMRQFQLLLPRVTFEVSIGPELQYAALE